MDTRASEWPGGLDDEEDYVSQRAEALIADLGRMRGRPCPDCATPVCAHDSLASLVSGHREHPFCAPCLASRLGNDLERTREHLFQYIQHRSCYHAAWGWCDREESGGPGSRPACSWSSTRDPATS